MIMKTQKLPNIYRIISLIAVLSTFFIRPFAMGLEYSIPGFIVCAILGYYVYNTLPHTTKNSKKIFILIFWFYLIATLLTSLDPRDYITRLGGATIAYMLCCNQTFMQLYFRYFKNMMLFICICAIINFVLEMFFSVDSLQICHIDFPEDQYEYYLSFPFSLSKMMLSFDNSIEGALNFLIGDHRRQYLFFVEPGMAPPFIMGLACILYYNRSKRFVIQIVILIVALFFTFSTTGVLLFLASIFLYYFFTHKHKFSIRFILICAGMGLATIYGYLYMPVFGRNAKLNSSAGVSIEDHEHIMGYVYIGTIVLLVLCFIIRRYKKASNFFMIISCLLLVGYLANYIAFTFLFTMFLFYDQDLPVENNKKQHSLAKMYKSRP